MQSDYVIFAADPKTPLNRQVWQHAEEAKRLGLELVVEISAKKERVSRSIDKLWKKKDALVGETLRGVYLVRVDLLEVGPKAAVGLTPYAIFGVPLFVAWNQLGQVLAPNALSTLKGEELVAVLSAFFEDVVKRRRHDLHPAPRLPVMAQPVDTRSRAKLEVATEAKPPSSPAPPARTAATSATTDPLSRLESELETVIENALRVARRFLLEMDLRSDCSLHSLRQLDAYLDEHHERCSSVEFAQQYLGALGVYLGCVVCAQADATWFVDRTQSSPIDALALRVTAPEGGCVFHPVAIALERLGDESKGFYGHAIAMCRSV